MARDYSKPKWFSGALGGAARQGLAELRNAMYPESNVARQVEYGVWGTKTPGEVAEDRRLDAMDMTHNLDLNEEPRSTLADRMKEIYATRDVRGRDNRPPERERD
jgi:hypothetical protein